MKKKINDQTLNIRIPNALHEQLKLVAESQYMPMSVMIRLALGEYVRTHATVALSRVAINPQLPSQPQSNAPKSPAQQQWEEDWGY
jgi:antitoxin component of RelBE/YafQ-DinJ toxin-antitoxin module